MIGYYYCSVPTFYNIITSRVIYLSDPLKMNDSEELRWFLRMAMEYMAELSEERPKAESPDAAVIEANRREALARKDEIMQMLKRAGDNFQKLIRGGQRSIYIGCFSGTKDSLSQWRGYAADGTGVALGFDLDRLTSSDKRLQYGEIKYRSAFRPEDTADVRKVIRALSEYDGSERGRIDIYKNILPVMAAYKSGGFYEEKEIRVTYWTGGESDADAGEVRKSGAGKSRSIRSDTDAGDEKRTDAGSTCVSNPEPRPLVRKYRLLKDDRMTGYVELPLKSDPDALREVVTGPKCRLNSFDIRDFIGLNWGNDFGRSLAVSGSEISYG